MSRAGRARSPLGWRLGGALAAAAAVALVLLLVLDHDAGDGTSAPLAHDTPAGASPATVTAAPTASPSVSGVTSLDAGGSEPAAPLAVAGAAGQASVRLHGLVLDEQGAPVAGARVAVLPTPEPFWDVPYTEVVPGSLAAWSSVPDPWTQAFALSADDGRFDLPVVLPRTAPVAGARDDGAPSEIGAAQPVLLVSHADFAPARQDCGALVGPVHDAGTLTLRRGGRVVGRCVDEHGQPLAGVQLGVNLQARRWPCPDGLLVGLSLMANGVDAAPDAIVEPEDRLTLVRSDAAGRFELVGLPPGPQRLEAQARGFLPVAPVAVSVGAGEVADAGTLTFVAGGRVTGTVVDPAGRPVAGAVVQAAPFALPPDAGVHQRFLGLRAGHESMQLESSARAARAAADLWATTDASGRFAISGLPGERVSLYAAADGRDVAGLEDVVVGADDLVLELDGLQDVELVCVDAAGEPLALRQVGVQARGEPLSWFDEACWVQRDLEPVDAAAGRWRLDDLCGHPLRVWGDTVGPRRHVFASVEAPLAALSDGRLTVRLEAWPRLSVRAVDEVGAVLVDAKARWIDSEGERFLRMDHGALAEQPPRDQSGTLRLSAPGHRARELPITSGARVDLGDVQLSPAPLVTVRVVDPDGQPSAGVRVALERRSGPRWWTTSHGTSDGLGLVELPWSEPGEHRVALLRGPTTVGLVTEPVSGTDPHAVALTLRAPEPMTVEGRVLRAGEPVAKAAVHVRVGDSHARTRSDDEGRFRWRLLSGEPASVWADSGRSLSPEVSLGPPPPSVVLPLDGAPYSGRLLGVPATPWQLRRHVSLVGETPDHRIGVMTDDDGSFHFDHVPAGDWTLEVRVFPDSKDVLASRVIGHPGPEPLLEVPTMARVGLTLRAAHGGLAASAYQVHLRPDGGGKRRTQALGEGGTRLSDLAPGRWRLLVTSPLSGVEDTLTDEELFELGLVLAETTVQLAPGDDRLVELTLPP